MMTSSELSMAPRMSELIAPAFFPVHKDLKAGLHSNYDLYGGRGSCKSSFISLEIVLGIVQDPEANAAVFRKVANTLRGSVYEQIGWAIDALGMASEWRSTVSPMQYTYKTGQQIKFFGLDDPKKLKSIKCRHGYFKYVWYEELDEFAGDKEIRNVQQSVARGTSGRIYTFKSFNPPISRSNWANVYVDTPSARSYRHKSCYLDVDPEWLGQVFLDEADDLKANNLQMYEHEYLGVPTGTGGEVFENLEIREISNEEIQRFDRIYMGIDWGWYPDPFHWTKVDYEPSQSTLYIFDEWRTNKTSNRDSWEYLKQHRAVSDNDLITADSADMKSIADLREYGAFIRPAEKGPHSREYSYKWLQSLKKIVIDPVRCPYTAQEFREYEYERTKDGEVLNVYPDGKDHSIDAVRYSLETIWKRRGQ